MGHNDFREPYMAVEATIKNLMTSLRAVTDLQNPAIKDRHWIELMMATKVCFFNKRVPGYVQCSYLFTSGMNLDYFLLRNLSVYDYICIEEAYLADSRKLLFF